MYKVFILDDEPLILEGLKNIINWESYNIKICGQSTSSVKALQQLQTINADILITDIRMPKLSGLELISKLTLCKPNMHFIILSGFNDFKYVKEAITLGVDNYLLKPINISELQATIENTILKIEHEIENNTIIENNKEIFKNNIFYRWVTNKIDNVSLKERLTLLNVNLTAGNYCIIKLFNFTDIHHTYNDPVQLIENVYTYLLKENKNTSDYIIFKCPTNELLILYYTDDMDSNLISSFALLIQKKIKQAFNLGFYISLGSIEHSFIDVPSSYQKALIAADFDLSFTNKKIILYDNIKNHVDNMNIAIDLNIDFLSDLIVSKDSNMIIKYINELFDNLTNVFLGSRHSLHRTLLKVIITVDNIVSSINPDFSGYDYHNLFYVINKSTDLITIHNYVQDLLLKAIESMKFVSDKSPIITKCLQIIHQYYYNNITLITLSNQLNLNSAYLGQLFKKEIGKSLANYLNQYRIQKAKLLLVNTNDKSSVIGRNIGYSDSNYFYTQFKKYTGLSPSKFRAYKK